MTEVHYTFNPSFTFSAGEISARAREAEGGVGESAERSGRGWEETPWRGMYFNCFTWDLIGS